MKNWLSNLHVASALIAISRIPFPVRTLQSNLHMLFVFITMFRIAFSMRKSVDHFGLAHRGTSRSTLTTRNTLCCPSVSSIVAALLAAWSTVSVACDGGQRERERGNARLGQIMGRW